MMGDERKMEIAWKTTPGALRRIAKILERDDCNQVRVNWHHTRLCFVLDRALRDNPYTFELDGETDGSIVSDDVDGQSQCEIIEAAQYLDTNGIRDMITYLKSLQENRSDTSQ